MDSKPAQAAQHQHYVPKFLLRNFLSDERKEQVQVFDKATGKNFTTSIRGIMAERRFNEFVVNDEWLATFEPAICEIEDQVLPVYRDVVANRRLQHTPEERGYLAYLMAFQMVRTKAQRDRFTEMDNLVRDKFQKMGAPEDQLAEFDFDPDHLKMRHASFMEHALKEFTETIAIKDYLLIEAAPGRSFYLGDAPMVMHNSGPRDPFWGNIGLSVKGIEIYLPLTSDLLMCAWCPTVIGGHRNELGDKRKLLSGTLLGRVMRGEITPSYMKREIAKINELAKPMDDLIAHVDAGTPVMATQGNMDLFNSLQMSYAVRHVINRDGDWGIARRFMKDNPDDRGRKIRAD